MNTELPLVTIDRARLGRGVLYNPDMGRYCALGFVLKACGVSDAALAATRGVVVQRSEVPPVLAPLFFVSGYINATRDWVWAVAYLNDGATPPPAGQTREEAITAVLEEQGFRVQWIN